MPICISIVIPVRKAAFYVKVLVVVWDLFGLSLHLYMFMAVRERDSSSSTRAFASCNCYRFLY